MLSLVFCCALITAEPEAAKTPDVPTTDAYWGMKMLPMNATMQAAYTKIYKRPCPVKIGVSVYELVDDGPGKKAGVKSADVIVSVDKKLITDRKDLVTAITNSKPGQKIVLDIRRPRIDTANWDRLKCTLIVGSRADRKAAEEAAAKEGPLKIVRAVIAHNLINEPVLAVRVKAKHAIEAYEIEADAFDKFNEPVKSWGFAGSEHTAMSQDQVASGEENTTTWTMHGAEGVGVFKCKLLRVKLADGTVWKPAEGTGLTFEAHLKGEQ